GSLEQLHEAIDVVRIAVPKGVGGLLILALRAVGRRQRRLGHGNLNGGRREPKTPRLYSSPLPVTCPVTNCCQRKEKGHLFLEVVCLRTSGRACLAASLPTSSAFSTAAR